MSELISKQFHNFVFNQGDTGGTKDVIADLNGVVSCNDIALSTVLDSGVGEKYFYESMKLAENVIISFEKEQPKLNENQEIVLEQMKASVQSNEKDIIQAVASIHIRCQLPKYYSKQPYKAYLQLTEKEEAQVLQAFASWVLEQEESE